MLDHRNTICFPNRAFGRIRSGFQTAVSVLWGDTRDGKGYFPTDTSRCLNHAIPRSEIQRGRLFLVHFANGGLLRCKEFLRMCLNIARRHVVRPC